LVDSYSFDYKMSEWKEYLKTIWYDPKHPGAFAGPDKLYKVVKKEGKLKVGRRRILSWLQDQDAYGLQKGIITKFKMSPVVVAGLDSLFDGDLADMQNVSKYNDGVKFLLVLIDVFSRFLWVVPLRDRLVKSVVEALNSVFRKCRKPSSMRFDKGSEFKNRWVKSYLNSKKVNVYFTENQTKANYAERVIKTIKNMIYRYFTAKQSYRYIDVLPDLVSNYNNRPHRSLNGFTPSSVDKNNEDEVRYLMYTLRKVKPKLQKKSSHKSRKKSPYKFKVGDKVRISHLKHPFQRDYQQKWTEELFVIERRYLRGNIPVYKLKDYADETISGTFYEREMQMVTKDTTEKMWRIEKVIRKRKRGGKTEVLVKWMGWPSKFNSWVSETQLEDV